MSENIKIYKKTEEGYPKTLLQLPDAPSRLYVLGELPDPMRPAIAIVGAETVVLMEKIWHMNMPEF